MRSLLPVFIGSCTSVVATVDWLLGLQNKHQQKLWDMIIFTTKQPSKTISSMFGRENDPHQNVGSQRHSSL